MLRKIIIFSFSIAVVGCSSLSKNKSIELEQVYQGKKINNVSVYKNIRSIFTDCEGEPRSAWVLISPRAFPESMSGKSAQLKFLVDDESKPYDVKLVEGDEAIADWSTRALLRSKFPNKPSSCWLVKYEYVD